MSTFTDPVAQASYDLQKVMEEQINMQSSTSSINCRVRENINKKIETDLEKQQKEAEKFDSLNKIISIIGTITTVVQILQMVLPPGGEQAVAAATEAPFLVLKGGLQIKAAEYNLEIIKTQAEVNASMSWDQYMVDKNGNNDSKMKQTYEGLSSFVEAVQRLIAILGRAKQTN